MSGRDFERPPRYAATAALVILGAAVGWLVSYLSGGANVVPPHLFYIPVFIAGWRHGLPAAILTGLACTFVAGPLLPANVAENAQQHATDWIVRGAFFIGIGTFMAVTAARTRRAIAHAMQATHREQDLATREAAFLQTVSHEVRTPLTVIRGSVDLLRARELSASDRRDVLGGLGRAVQRLDDLCTLALASAGGIEQTSSARAIDVELPALVKQIARDMRPEHRRRLRVAFERPARVARSDPKLLRPLVSELIVNAMKFSPADSHVNVDGRVHEGRLTLRIRDHEGQIDPVFLDQAFLPFTQEDASLRRANDGLGIGLFAARKLASRLGCELTIRNHPEGGVEAVLVFLGDVPATRPSSDAHDPTPPPHAQTSDREPPASAYESVP